MSCETNHELILLYVADALDEHQRVELAAHLESGCESCNQSIDEARAVVGMLPLQLPAESAPTGSLDRFMDAVRSHTAPVSSARLAESKIPQRDLKSSKREQSRSSQQRNKLMGLGWLTAIAAAVVLTLSASTIWWITQAVGLKNSQIAALEQHVSMRESELFLLVDDHDRYERLTSMLHSPDTKIVELVLVSPKPESESEAEAQPGRVVFDAESGELFLFASQLPEISESESFHLWAQAETGPVHFASFRRDSTGETTVNIRDIETKFDIATVFVTVESVDEVAAPGTRIIVRAKRA